MIDLSYELWKDVCDNMHDYAKNFGKYYLQLYPLSFKECMKYVSDSEFYEKYILTGAIFEFDNFNFPENFCIKHDGTIRQRYLLTPIMYLYYIALGKYISSKNLNRIINSNYECYYAGNFEKNIYHYKESYDNFVGSVIETSNEYKYYIKIDIASFFDNIDIRILKRELVEHNILTETEGNIIETLLLLFGNGKFPQTECGLTSSYLSTLCYLRNSDIALLNFLDNYSHFKDYKVIRYVDDLFIFYNLNDNYSLFKIQNDIVNFLNDVYHNYNLCINKQKLFSRKSKNILDDLKSLSNLDDFEISNEIEDSFSRNIILKFLNKLINAVNSNGISYTKYISIVNECFNSKKLRYHSFQIYYCLIYKNSKWISNTDTINALTKALDNDYNLLSYDPKVLTTLIMKTENSVLIKKMLEKLFLIHRSKQWNSVCSYISLIYLFNSGFKHIDLLSVLKDEDILLYRYIKNHFTNLWAISIVSNNTRRFVNNIYNVKSNIFYLYLMYIYELKNGNYLHAFSYFKNYFDVITAHFYAVVKKSNRRKFSVENFYKENPTIRFYSEFHPDIKEEISSTIKETYIIRNSNPVCHGSAELLYGKYSRQDIFLNIDKLNKIIVKSINTL